MYNSVLGKKVKFIIIIISKEESFKALSNVDPEQLKPITQNILKN